MAVAAPPPTTTVEAVVVRQIRLPEPAGDKAFSIIRLDQAALRASPRLDESLSRTPSFSLFRRTSSLNANPTTQGASLRAIAGSGASRALVSLDGVPQNDAFGGWVIWTSLPSDLIASAEVVRGAGAGPYGAGALTGTVSLHQLDAVPGNVAADVSYGDHNDFVGQAIGSAQVGSANIVVNGAGENSGGYVPVHYGPPPNGRGPVDQPLTLSTWTTSGRLTEDIGQGVLAVRGAAFEESRGSGIVGAASRVRGENASLSYTRAPTPDALGYRIQGWIAASDLMNTSTSVASTGGQSRNVATPAGDQYATPALGYGFNGAVRRAGADYSLEIGADVRVDSGQSQEFYAYSNGHYTRQRFAGGDMVVGGLYAEGSHTVGPWLLTGGVRVDGWSYTDGHRLERLISTGAVTFDQRTPIRAGAEPTARIGLRRDFSGGWYARTAAYAGFRPITLNELYRPFRVGNDLTEANPALKPERLYGAEAGFGNDGAHGGWAITGFYNQLQDAVVNATVAKGPIADPYDPVGNFVAAGGTLYQRRNVNHIDAEGIEADAHWAPMSSLNLRGGVDYTHAVVEGGSAAPQLTGKRPAETPEVSATAGADWRPIPRLTLSADARYESTRFDDDQNTRPLGPGVTVDARVEVHVAAAMVAYVAADNLFDVQIPYSRNAGGLVSYDAPRMVRFGLAWRR
jgi:outer membrane receptor protein involved in Fe transport